MVLGLTLAPGGALLFALSPWSIGLLSFPFLLISLLLLVSAFTQRAKERKQSAAWAAVMAVAYVLLFGAVGWAAFFLRPL